jgi:hypothetical protein
MMDGSNFHIATWYLAQKVALLRGLVEQININEQQNYWNTIL